MNTTDKTQLFTALRGLVTSEGNQSLAAWKLGISESYLSDVLSGRSEPGKKILIGLKFRRVITYEPEIVGKE